MNKEQDYASDTDESDEEFRPDAAGESAVSEEDSNGCENEEEHEGGDEATKQNVRKSKKLTKKVSRKRKPKNKDDDDTDDENTTENDESLHRRSTRQTDGSRSNGRGKGIEKDTLESDEEDKARTNALWANFLNDVTPVTAASTTKPNTNATQENASSSSYGKAQTRESTADKPKLPNKESATAEGTKKLTVTEVLDFAGEEVRVQKEIDASSIKENKAIATAAPKMQPFGRIMPGAGIKRPAGSGSSGLGSLLNQIGKKKKLSVLEKSQMDWKSFKTDEGIEEQLQTFNKGKDGYLERQDFLQRTDLRQFEIEKNLRQSSRRPL